LGDIILLSPKEEYKEPSYLLNVQRTYLFKGDFNKCKQGFALVKKEKFVQNNYKNPTGLFVKMNPQMLIRGETSN
jgi:hypothetical protein